MPTLHNRQRTAPMLTLHRSAGLVLHERCKDGCTASPQCPGGVCARAASPLYIAARMEEQAAEARRAGVHDQDDAPSPSPASKAINTANVLRGFLGTVIGLLAVIGAVSLWRFAIR